MALAKYTEEINEIVFERMDKLTYKGINIRWDASDEKPNVLPLKENKQNETNHGMDKLLICQDCGRVFFFSDKAQKLFKERGWDDPISCGKCKEYKMRMYKYYRGY